MKPIDAKDTDAGADAAAEWFVRVDSGSEPATMPRSRPGSPSGRPMNAPWSASSSRSSSGDGSPPILLMRFTPKQRVPRGRRRAERRSCARSGGAVHWPRVC